jgi:hypothetical protein
MTSGCDVKDYVAGDTLTINVEITTPAGGPQDLAGANLRWDLAPQPSAGEPSPASLLSKSIGAGITVTDAAGGKARIVVGKGEIATPATYVHQLELTLATGESYTVMRGRVTASAAIRPD